MGEEYISIKHWVCVWCSHKWPARDDQPEGPKTCRLCGRHDWYAGNGSGARKRATILRPVGKKHVLKKVQLTGKTALEMMKRLAEETKKEKCDDRTAGDR